MRLNLASRKEEAHDDAVWAATWAAGGTGVLSGSVDETVKMWTLGQSDTPALDHLHTWSGHTLGVVSIDVEPRGEFAASSSLDSFIRIWNIQDHSTKAVLETAPSETWQVKLQQAEDRLLIAAAGGSSNKIVIYNVDEAKAVQELKLPPVRSLIPHTSVWTVCLPQLLLPLHFHVHLPTLCCNIAACLPGLQTHKCQTYASAALCGKLPAIVLHTCCHQSGAYLCKRLQVDDKRKKETFVLSLAYSPDGTRIACGCMDGIVVVFDVSTTKIAALLEGHFKPVRSIAFTPGEAVH